MNAKPISADQVAALLRRAQLDPERWNLPDIARKTNAWITENLNELSCISAAWTPGHQAAHLAEFGSLTAVDFVEQCVIEAGPTQPPGKTSNTAQTPANSMTGHPSGRPTQRSD